jgi:hypothetical protein
MRLRDSSSGSGGVSTFGRCDLKKSIGNTYLEIKLAAR